ncbi:DUF423 domain-containing protein [Lewinella cohaerens]|uniref:DUF423 domain-containing protein n=1 Tax=Lewinella cohaerens TaxID=70995 RepID=UPI000367B45E|nr:DUF423 domain-containing protein [Lewinella cohaerens]
MRKNFLRIGAILMALGVIFGAFGAHGLKEIVSAEKLGIFETGTRYQIYHAFAILLVGTLLYFRKTSLMPIAGWLFLGGIVCFSGSLYLLAFADLVALPTNLLGPITPIGGLLFVAGWVVLAISTFQDNEKRYRKSHSE